SNGAYRRIHAGGIATTRKNRDVLHEPDIMGIFAGCSPSSARKIQCSFLSPRHVPPPSTEIVHSACQPRQSRVSAKWAISASIQVHSNDPLVHGGPRHP